MSKVKQFEAEYLTHEGVITGTSGFIKRYRLPEYCAYTSGDGIFRNDATLGRKYKMCRFSENFNPDRKTSKCWRLTDEDKQMLRLEHATLTFPQKGEDGYKAGGTTVYYIKCYGKGIQILGAPIRTSIRKAIEKQPCANCGTTTDIECDHKNDLQNDTRVLNTQTQRDDDFQPLCGHCNKAKRNSGAKRDREGKRQPAPGFPARLAFTEGDETLDRDNINWGIGTYWFDVKAFKEKLTLK